MSAKETNATISRRGFLKGVAAASGTAAASVVISESANATTTTQASEVASEDSSKGYHLSPHILEYYEKARF